MFSIADTCCFYSALLSRLFVRTKYVFIISALIIGYSWTTAAIFPTDSIQNSTHTKATTMIDEDEIPDPPRNFTLEQLSHFNGTKDEKSGEDKPVYLSLNGIVFDVSKGRDFYGPGGPYEKVIFLMLTLFCFHSIRCAYTP
jgi:Cytochrome b5-like Heme/Steroid binding domain